MPACAPKGCLYPDRGYAQSDTSAADACQPPPQSPSLPFRLAQARAVARRARARAARPLAGACEGARLRLPARGRHSHQASGPQLRDIPAWRAGEPCAPRCRPPRGPSGGQEPRARAEAAALEPPAGDVGCGRRRLRRWQRARAGRSRGLRMRGRQRTDLRRRLPVDRLGQRRRALAQTQRRAECRGISHRFHLLGAWAAFAAGLSVARPQRSDES